MTSQLTGALRCLCVEIGWSYAVFWRAIGSGSHSSVHLVWEDGFGVDQRVDLQGMRQQVHVFGERIVGQAAATGSHQWVLGGGIDASGSGSEGLADLNHQFLAGIQTIAAIPVLPHGVLQLGSTQMVMENIKFVNHVHNLFGQLISMTGAPSPNSQLCEGIPLGAPEMLLGRPNIHLNSQFDSRQEGTRGLLHNPDMELIQPAFSCDLSSVYQDQSLPLTTGLSSNLPFPGEQLAMFSTKSWEYARNIESESYNTGTSQLNLHQYIQPYFPKDFNKDANGITYANSSGTGTVQMSNKRSHSKITHGILVEPYSRQSYINSSEPMVANQKKVSGLLQACDVPCDVLYVNETLLSDLQECKLSSSSTCQKNQTYSSGANASHIKQDIDDDDDDDDECKLPRVFPIQTTSGSDLYDILGPDYKTESFDVFENKTVSSIHELAQLGAYSISHSLNEGISGTGMFSVADTNQLLDAVVSNINSDGKETSDDSSSCKASVTTTSSSSIPVVSPIHKFIASSEQMQDKTFGLSTLLGKDDGTSPNSPKVAPNLGKMNRKRAKPGENPRPRPKDRQMIMDRVKELRDIVPNGAKCSIDALLEKTINHLLFLQNVSKHGQYLKDIGEPKLIDKEGGLRMKENFQGGATWAFQVGTQSMSCPIIVEDLNPPRQMLVEMLCEQRGFFLEIADLIRSLGLTILNGVMEAHKDKIWARFAVEANRDVSRMEIFLSLVRLLESTIGSSTTPHGVGENINMPHNVYNHSCIAATGTSD